MIQGLNNKNYRLKIPELQHEILLAECKYNVKKNGVSITLIKKDPKENWTDIKPKVNLINTKKSAAKTGEKKDDT